MNITDTGVRGFLKWLKTQQPGLYPKIAREISDKVPGAFDDYHAGGWRVAGLDQTSALAVMSVDPGLIPAPTVDVSEAADSGGKSSSITDTIASIVKGISSLYLTKKQADVQQQVVNTQLQRAAAGLPPLDASIANLGVPQVSVGLSAGTGTGVAIAVGGALLLMAFGVFSGRRSARR
jgi:hypothetical protein